MCLKHARYSAIYVAQVGSCDDGCSLNEMARVWTDTKVCDGLPSCPTQLLPLEIEVALRSAPGYQLMLKVHPLHYPQRLSL